MSGLRRSSAASLAQGHGTSIDATTVAARIIGIRPFTDARTPC